jgi:DNA-binding transcriptional LysR family regulator
VPDDYADRLLPQVLAAFNRLNPSIEVQVECTSSARLTDAIRVGDLDVAITTSGDTNELRGEIIRREALYWVTSEGHCAHAQDVLRLALGPSSCSWRRLSMDALDRIGRRYRVSYTSGSASALVGAVQAGLAVTVFPESAIRDGMRILDEKDGFPSLPHCDIAMLRSDSARQPIHDRLCNHLIAAIGNVGTVGSQEAAE